MRIAVALPDDLDPEIIKKLKHKYEQIVRLLMFNDIDGYDFGFQAPIPQAECLMPNANMTGSPSGGN